MKKPTKYVGLMAVMFMTLLMLGCASTPNERGSQAYVSDAWITSKVKSSLLADPQVSGLDIQVETYKGVVQLSGFVPNQDQADRAVELAERIEGVKKVENRMTVR